MSVDPIPPGFHSVTAYLSCTDSAAAIEFYCRAFGAQETRRRLVAPDGTVMNAELRIGDTRIMLADQAPNLGSRSPLALGASSVNLVLHLPDVDTVFARAIELGASEVIPVADQFYGDRSGRLRDPFGHVWILATHVEDVSDDEMIRRFEAMFSA